MARSPGALIEMFSGLVGWLLGLPWWLLGLLWRFKPYVMWLMYEAWCVHGWWSSRNVDSDLARRVLEKGKTQHRATCVALAVWQFIVPWMLGVKYDAWGAWSPCVCAVSAWALCAMMLLYYPCIFALHLQWHEREVLWYKKCFEFCGWRTDEERRHSVAKNLRQNKLCQVLSISCYELFLLYSTIAKMIQLALLNEKTEQMRPTKTVCTKQTCRASNACDCPTLENIRLSRKRSVKEETMLYTFKFVCAALPFRLALVGVCWMIWFLFDKYQASQQDQVKQLRVAAVKRAYQEAQRLLASRQPNK